MKRLVPAVGVLADGKRWKVPLICEKGKAHTHKQEATTERLRTNEVFLRQTSYE